MGEGLRKFIRDMGKVGLVIGALSGSPKEGEAKAPVVTGQHRDRLAEIIDGDKTTKRGPALIPADIMEHYKKHGTDDDSKARDDGADEAYK